MATEDEKKIAVIKRIKEEIARLDQASAKAYQDTLKSLNATVAGLDSYQKLLNNIKNDVANINTGFSGILEEIKKINGELQKGDKNTKDATKSLRGLESIAQKLKYDQQGYNDLNLDQLKTEQSKLKILENQARNAAQQLAEEKGIVDLAHTNLSFRKDLTKEEEAILRAAQEGFTVYERTNKLLEKRVKEEEKINRKLGLTGVLLKGMSKIPIVGPLLEVNKALELARIKAKAGGNAFQVMGTALGSVGKSLLTNLTDPLVIIGLLVKGFQELLNLGFKTDKQVVALQKSLFLSREGAEGLRENFQYIKDNNQVLVKGLDQAYISVRNQIEATSQLADAMGAVSLATNKEIQGQILLTKQFGLTNEEAAQAYVLARQNNMAVTDVTDEIIGQVKANQSQTGVLLNSKKIIQDTVKISGQLRLQYGNNVKQLTAAVIQANKLGFSLEQTKKIAEGLLNFEQSIENELSAELLIGRDLNLEQARLLALNGKSAEATALIAEQMGGSAEFSKLNVIQQEQLAKALGMSADELANSMLHQENLSKLGREDKKRLEDQLSYLRSIGQEEQAQQLERAIANGTNIEAALTASEVQARFYESIEKIKETLADIVDGPAMKFANGLVNILSNTEALKGILFEIGTIFATMSLAGLIRQLALAAVSAGTLSIASAAAASALTLGVAAFAIMGSIAAIASSINNAQEKIKQPPKSNYASGGIVGGNSLAGDNMKINANSGEMVLNRRQQSNLFNMINNGGGGGNIYLTADLIMDDKKFALAVANVERKNSNNLASERQLNNRPTQ